MTERSLFWDGVALGDCGPYTSAQLHDQMLRSITGCTGDKGVLLNWLNNLEVTGETSPVSVNTGAALVYGRFFESDSAVSLTISTPNTGYSRYDVIVVRRDISTQTIRLGKVIGTASLVTPSVPALTQDPASTYEIPLAYILVDDTGALEITDARDWAVYSSSWPAALVTGDMIVGSEITADKMANQTRWEVKGAGQIEPDNTNPCTLTVGANYDFWDFATAVTNEAWVYFMAPTGLVAGSLAFYLWNAPDAAAAGNVDWEYSVYYGDSDVGALTNATGSTVVAQGGRAVANSYRDAFFTITTAIVTEGQIIALQVRRDGGGGVDTYGSSMRLLGIEMEWTADA